jgi:ATP-dependent Clp protease ATP-binding subunit ClpC
MLLQIMEEGHLSDARGRKVDFRNAIIVMTSNLGAELIMRQAQLGFNIRQDRDLDEKLEYGEMRKKLMEALRREFRPEFINRVDAVIVFHALSMEQITQIVDLELEKVGARLESHRLRLFPTEEARALLAEQGYDPEMGARPLKRVIQNKVEDRLSDALLAGEFKDGDSVVVTVRDGEIVLERGEVEQAEAPEALPAG